MPGPWPSCPRVTSTPSLCFLPGTPGGLWGQSLPGLLGSRTPGLRVSGLAPAASVLGLRLGSPRSPETHRTQASRGVCGGLCTGPAHDAHKTGMGTASGPRTAPRSSDHRAFRFVRFEKNNKRIIQKARCGAAGQDPWPRRSLLPQAGPPGSQLPAGEWAVRPRVGGIWANALPPGVLSPQEATPWGTSGRYSPQQQMRWPQAGLEDTVGSGWGRVRSPRLTWLCPRRGHGWDGPGVTVLPRRPRAGQAPCWHVVLMITCPPRVKSGGCWGVNELLEHLVPSKSRSPYVPAEQRRNARKPGWPRLHGTGGGCGLQLWPRPSQPCRRSASEWAGERPQNLTWETRSRQGWVRGAPLAADPSPLHVL